MTEQLVIQTAATGGVDVQAGSSAMPLVSVIIPAFNDNARLQQCLDALERQTYPSECFEIVIVDNGSVPPASESIQVPANGVLLAEPAAGSYAARNRGLAVARGTLIGFTDSDCVPAPDWIETAARRMCADESLAFIAGRIEVTAPASATIGSLYDQLFAFPQKQYVERDRFGATANVFVRRSIIEDVGAFDATLQSGGDVEWGRRVHAAGYRQLYDDHVVVKHPARTSVRMLRLKTIRIASGLFAQAVGGRMRWRQLVILLTRMSVPSFSELWRIMRAPTIRRPADKAGVAAVAVYLRYVFCATLASLLLGARRLDQRQPG